MVLTPEQRGASNAALVSTGAALLTLLPIAAHQLGFLDHLPDPRGAIFDSDTITESRTAHPLGIPDSLLGLASYATTFALLLAARRSRFAGILLKHKLTVDASAASANSIRQVIRFRRLCSWCTGTALATIAVVHFGRKSLD